MLGGGDCSRSWFVCVCVGGGVLESGWLCGRPSVSKQWNLSPTPGREIIKALMSSEALSAHMHMHAYMCLRTQAGEQKSLFCGSA